MVATVMPWKRSVAISSGVYSAAWMRIASTGRRVPLISQVPDTLPAICSTSGQRDQSMASHTMWGRCRAIKPAPDGEPTRRVWSARVRERCETQEL